MGDADSSRQNPAQHIDQMTGVLDALNEDLTNLHDTVQYLEQRTLRELSVQLNGYLDYRRFFLAMNLIILPLIISAALCYSLKEMAFSDETEVIFQSLIMIMLYVAGSLGVPLYLSTLWAIYSFNVSEEVTDDFVRELLNGFREQNGIESEESYSAAENDLATQSSSQDVVISEAESDLSSEEMDAKKSPSVDFLILSEAEILEANEGTEIKKSSSEVHCGSDVMMPSDNRIESCSNSTDN